MSSAAQTSADAPHFDHYQPAAFLAENPKVARELPELDGLLDRFEKLFEGLNALLPKYTQPRLMIVPSDEPSAPEHGRGRHALRKHLRKMN